MKILAIDTANAYCSIAIITDDAILDSMRSTQVNKQAESLFIMIEALLERNSLSYRSIDIFVVTKGPGSFTGVRIGMAAAKGLSLITQKKLYGISTLETLAFIKISSSKDNIHAILNAGRDKAYYQLFTCDLEPLCVPKIISIGEIGAFNGTIATNVSGYGEVLPDAKYAGMLACKKLKAKEEMPHLPLYVRSVIHKE